MHTNCFQKRIYTPAAFSADIHHAAASISRFRAAKRTGRVDQAFAERIMLAVTQVNGCRYCQYGHSRMALRAGVSAGEIRQLASGTWDDLPEGQLPALMYAQHYAETGGKPDTEANERLAQIYGEETAQDIQANIRMITMGNLLGNTFDAFVSRLRGKPAPNSSFWQELAVLLETFTIPCRFIWIRLTRKQPGAV